MNSDKEKLLCQLSLGRAFGVVTKNYWGALSKKLEHLGFDRYFSTLIAIEKATEKCTQQYLCDVLKIDKVGMVRQLDYLVEKGLIKRETNPKDRREHLIFLTPFGIKMMPKIHQEIKELNKVAFEGFNEAEQENFKNSIEKIINNIQALPIIELKFNVKKVKK